MEIMDLLLYFLCLYGIENITILISQILEEYGIIHNIKLKRLTQNLVYSKVINLILIFFSADNLLVSTTFKTLTDVLWSINIYFFNSSRN